MTPQCWTEGEQVEGSNVVLKCYCQGGSAPLSYQWSRVEEDFAAGGLPLGTGQGKQCEAPWGAGGPRPCVVEVGVIPVLSWERFFGCTRDTSASGLSSSLAKGSGSEWSNV